MVPPEPDLIAAVEAAALWAWPPRETRYLEGWLLRAGALGVRRVNSAQTLAFAAPERLATAVRSAERWYAERGRAACFQLTELAAPPGLDGELAGRGYTLLAPSLVLLADADLPAPEPGRVEILHRPIQSVLAAMAEPVWSDAVRYERAQLLARIRRPHRFGLVTVGGEPAAAGLVVVDGGLAGLFGLRTGIPFRRRRLGRQLLLALAAWARDQGARRLYLQVEAANAPASALYAAAGFALAYRYWYREATEP